MTLLFLVGPAAVGFLLALFAARTRWGVVAVGGLGVAVAFPLILWMFLSASTDRNCSDCDEVLGRYVSTIFLSLVLLGLVGWVAGVIVGTAVGRGGDGRARARPREVPPLDEDRS